MYFQGKNVKLKIFNHERSIGSPTKKIETREIETILITSSDSLVVEISTGEKSAHAIGIPIVENALNSAIAAAMNELGLFEYKGRVTGLISGTGKFFGN